MIMSAIERLKSPASLLFTQPFVQAQITEKSLALVGEMYPFDDVIM